MKFETWNDSICTSAPLRFFTPCHFYLILIRALSAPKLTFSHPDHSQDRGDGIFFSRLMQTAAHPTEKRQGQFGVLIPDPPALS